VVLARSQDSVVRMTARLVRAVRDAGTDNVQAFEAVIRDPRTGRVATNYKVVNVVGVVSCADLGLSKYASSDGPPIVDVSFDSLVIDDKRTGGQPIGRLTEALSA